MEFTISAKNGPIATKQKQTYWLNSKLQIWPSDLTLAVSLTFIIQGQICNSLYVGQNGLIATKKQTHLLNSKPQMWSDFYPCHDLDYEFWRSNLEFAIYYIFEKYTFTELLGTAVRVI